MNKSETIGKLATALSAVQAQLQRAPENAKNPFFKSNYADLGSVWDTCRQLLTDNGLSVVQMPSTPPVEFLPAVSLTTILMHESGEWISDTVTTPIAKSDPQGVGSALTYMRRYALAGMVGIVTGDDDGNNASNNNQPARKAAPKQSQNNEPLFDPRGETSPQSQAKRERPSAKPATNGGMDWKKKAIDAPNFSAFAAAVVAAGIGYNHAKHVEGAMEKLAIGYGDTGNEELYDILEARKQSD